uniref:Uncharacterized protein n=1 Tax=Tetraselmis chuii TaxID=63592 RepID=A0A6U1GNL7_9CHLO
MFDVMDTVVRDPFYKHMPAHFNMTFKELLAAKHPSAWLEFEKGRISQDEFELSFFADGRSYDREGLRHRMRENYTMIEGMEEVLAKLQAAGYDMHIMSNYPVWYRFVEERCQLSRFLPWTFMSCEGPMQGLRKPDPACFQCAMEHLGKGAGELVLIDDRPPNVEAARESGLSAILFESTEQLRAEMSELDIHF